MPPSSFLGNVVMLRKPAIAAAGLVALAAFGGILVWQHGIDSRQAPVSLQPDNPNVVALGQAVYAEHCASCHGANLEGQPNWRQRLQNGRMPAPPHDAAGHTWHHPDPVLFALTKFGPSALIGKGYESDMPGFEGILNDNEIIAVLSYIKSRWPREVQQRHDQIGARQ